MTRPVIFGDLPVTFPEEDKHKTPAAIGSIAIHIVLVSAVILIPLLIPQRVERWQLMALVAPLAPPPPAAPQVSVENLPKPAVPEVQPKIQVDPGVIVMPTEIPREIAHIVDDAPAPAAVGFPGGVPGGVPNSLLSSLLLASVHPAEPAAPPPPPPPPPPPSVAPVTAPPPAPVRVGGIVKEPRAVKVVPPVYPSLAKRARVTGTVILEATVTSEGAVEEIRIVSGHPLLVQAAIDCVKQWRYEPTYLNGEPVPVLLDAKVHFELGAL
jgi:protein TonB